MKLTNKKTSYVETGTELHDLKASWPENHRDMNFMSNLPDAPMGYSLRYLNAKEVLLLSTVSISLNRIASQNVVWNFFLIQPRPAEARGHKYLFKNNPEFRVSAFTRIGRNGFNFFEQNVQINIAVKLQEIKKSIGESKNLYDTSTGESKIATLSLKRIQELIKLNVFSIDFICNLSNPQRHNLQNFDLFNSKISPALSRLEKNPATPALEKAVADKVVEVINSITDDHHRPDGNAYFSQFPF